QHDNPDGQQADHGKDEYVRRPTAHGRRPSFVFAAFIERVVTWAKRSTVLATFLRGVSSASIALMAVVLWRLADEALVDSWTIATFAAALIVIQSRRALKRPRHRRA
ncbi:MAG: chromate transporter, partial [Actinomycetota bacterium]